MLSESVAIEKISKYCAYQERSQWEVRNKLLELGIRGLELENIIALLIEENFLNELRFAEAIARGKFYQKKWGKIKIKALLKQHQISDYCIKKALSQIPNEEYYETLIQLGQKKIAQIRSTTSNKYILLQKCATYLLQKGYETNLIHELVLNEIK